MCRHFKLNACLKEAIFKNCSWRLQICAIKDSFTEDTNIKLKQKRFIVAFILSDLLPIITENN